MNVDGLNMRSCCYPKMETKAFSKGTVNCDTGCKILLNYMMSI